MHFDMQEYRSHKKVWAAEIETVNIDKDVILTFKDCKPVNFTIERYSMMTVRYTPICGDFLVIYEDGYQSFSPRKAFLEGYSKI